MKSILVPPPPPPLTPAPCMFLPFLLNSPSLPFHPPPSQVHTVSGEGEGSGQDKAAETEAIADYAQKDLDQALPVLEAANTVSDFMLDHS